MTAQTDPPTNVGSTAGLGVGELPLRLLAAVETVQGRSGASIQLRGELERLLGALMKARGALSNLMLEPHGCSLCDSGVPRNNAKGHQPDCPYVRAVEAMDAADDVLTA